MISLSALALSGCETPEDLQIADAQACLDQANTEAQANVCMDKVSSLHSQEADLIRCSAHFVAQNFTTAKMTSAFASINDSSQTGNGTAALMAYMVFDDAKTRHTSTITQTDCGNSGVEGLQQLSKVVAAATKIVASGGAGFDFTNPVTSIQTNIDAMIATGTPTDKAALGALAVSLNSSFCSGSSSYGSSDVCTTLAAAIATGAGNNATIATELLNYINR
jgi:hypothetical protein